MVSKSKQKGNGFERELVQQFLGHKWEAKRAWGSNGAALGEHESVDLIAGGLKLQAKRRKKLPDWLGFTPYVDGVVFREDRGEAYIMLRLEEFVERYQPRRSDDSSK